jgi:hypothetical protein
VRIEQRSSSDEKKVLAGMILDRQVLSRVAAQWKSGMFRTAWCNLVGQWCVDYLQRYDAPPGREVESLYNSWAERSQDKTTTTLVGDFLETLSDEFDAKDLNPDYLTDLAGRHFNTVRMEKLAEAIQDDIAAGQSAQALERLTTWNKVELGAGAGIDVTGDMNAIREAFEVRSEPLIEFPGALGQFFGTILERDGFIGIMAPEGRGKSFWLSEIAYQGLVARKRVAFFEVGDMSQAQILRRIMCRVARRPLTPCMVAYPTAISREKGSHTAQIETVDKLFEQGLSWQKAWKETQHLMEKRVRSTKTYWKLSCHPAQTVSVRDIRGILDGWEREGWTPDMVVIDYADILAPISPRLEFRHQINETWQALRALSSSLHCLLVTATQTDADSYQRNVITRKNFSEDKRKLAHVTGMFALNQTIEEQELGIMRLNWLKRREGAYKETSCVHVAGSLALANPAIISCW